jgi:C-terminal processing protease CtpA/Prc
MFRKAGLGPLVGKRSWGGVVGITGLGPMIDGGQIFVPISGTNDVDGKWIIEGHGVDPDIEVENDPKSVIAGRDPQLERAVEELVRKMDAEPMRLPQRPPDPVARQAARAGEAREAEEKESDTEGGRASPGGEPAEHGAPRLALAAISGGSQGCLPSDEQSCFCRGLR